MLSPAARREFCDIALVEMTSIMRYYLQGNLHPWRDLSQAALRAHMVSNPVAFLNSVDAPAWKLQLSSYGWLEIHEPHKPQVEGTPRMQELLVACANALRECGQPWVQLFASVVEESADLERTCKAEILDAGRRCKREPSIQSGPVLDGKDMAWHVLRLRAAVALADGHFGQKWPVFVGIAADAATLDRQLRAKLLRVLVYSQAHWALLCVGTGQAVHYDGRDDSVTYDHSEGFVELRQQGRLSHDVRLTRAELHTRGCLELRTSRCSLHGCRHGRCDHHRLLAASLHSRLGRSR